MSWRAKALGGSLAALFLAGAAAADNADRYDAEEVSTPRATGDPFCEGPSPRIHVTVDNIMAKVNTNNAAGKRNLLFFLIGILDNFHCPRLRKDLHVLVILHPRSILVCPVILSTCKHKPKHFNILISVSRNL